MSPDVATSEGEPIASAEWLREFADGYMAAWNGADVEGIAARIADDVVWSDPALAEPARGRSAVADFARSSFVAFPDLRFAEPGPPAISADGLVAYAPWRMTATNTGPIDPPGFAATGKPVAIDGIDVWRFRDGLIWRYQALYDFSEVARQLGLLPPRDGFAQVAIVRGQRLLAKLRG